MVHSIPEKEYLKQDIKELEDELELADYQWVATVIIEEIKKELRAKKDRLSFIINWS